MNNSKPSSNWLTWKKIACVLGLLLAAGYIAGRPALEKLTGMELPAIFESEQAGEDKNKPAADAEDVRANGEQPKSVSKTAHCFRQPTTYPQQVLLSQSNALLPLLFRFLPHLLTLSQVFLPPLSTHHAHVVKREQSSLLGLRPFFVRR